jgi:hypothetical protein
MEVTVPQESLIQNWNSQEHEGATQETSTQQAWKNSHQVKKDG